MGNISRYLPRDFIEKVKSSTDFVSLVSEYTNLKKAGKGYVGLCPFHHEKTPSFNINPELGLYHCFGCGKGGDIFKFVAEKENLTYYEAVIYLARKNGIPIPTLSPKESSEIELLYQIYEFSAAFFRRQLVSDVGREARNYIIERGIRKDTIDMFQLGYAPQEGNSLFKSAVKEGFPKDLLLSSGLFKEKNGQVVDLFWDRLMFPIFSATGRVLAFGGRVISPNDTRPKYLNSPETKIFHKSETLYGLNFAKQYIRETGRALLVEGYMDALSLYEAGFKNVVASSGTALTPSQARQLRRYTENIIIVYDGDRAGFTASIRAIKILLEANFLVKLVRLPPESDPDSFVRKDGKEAFLALLNSAPDWFDYLVSILKKKYSLVEPANSILWVNKLAPFFSSIKDPIMLGAYASALGSHIHIQPDEIIQRIKSARDTRVEIQNTKSEIDPSKKRELRIFYSIFCGTECVAPSEIEKYKEFFLHYPGILERVLEEIKEGRNLTLDQLYQFFVDEPDAQSVFSQFSFSSLPPPPLSEQLRELREFVIMDNIKKKRDSLRVASAKGDEGEQIRIMEEINKLYRMLISETQINTA